MRDTGQLGGGMGSRERVRATIDFAGPDRLPYMIAVDLRRFQQERPGDVKRIVELDRAARHDINVLEDGAPPGSAPTSTYRAMVEDGVDMWGIRWRSAYAYGHPLLENDFDLDGYRFPDPKAEGVFAEATRIAGESPERYQLAQVWWTLFERMHLLRGFENALTDYLVHPAEFRRLQGRIYDYAMALLDHWIEARVDGIYFSDDWGNNERLLISPRAWRTHWKPLYRELFRRVRDHGMHVWFHSCGNVTEILPDLVDLGLNVLNPIQPKAMDISALARKYGGAVCFHGGVDVQGTLPHGNPDDVRREVRYLIETLGRFRGGYIGGVSHTVITDVPMENIEALYAAFKESV